MVEKCEKHIVTVFKFIFDPEINIYKNAKYAIFTIDTQEWKMYIEISGKVFIYKPYHDQLDFLDHLCEISKENFIDAIASKREFDYYESLYCLKQAVSKLKGANDLTALINNTFKHCNNTESFINQMRKLPVYYDLNNIQDTIIRYDYSDFSKEIEDIFSRYFQPDLISYTKSRIEGVRVMENSDKDINDLKKKEIEEFKNLRDVIKRHKENNPMIKKSNGAPLNGSYKSSTKGFSDKNKTRNKANRGQR